MTYLRKANNAKTTLASDITASSLTITVTSSSTFPDNGDFLITIWDKETYPDPSDDSGMEILKVIGVSGNTFTVQREQESTTAKAHVSGNAVEMLFTAGHLTELETAIDTKENSLGFTPENSANKGEANGYAELDETGKVPIGQLPTNLMQYKGTWNANTNTPTLIDGTGTTGDFYRVNVAGSQDLGSGSITFNIGDYLAYNGIIWEKLDATDLVTSVAGKTGDVTLDNADVGLSNVPNLDTTDAVNKTHDQNTDTKLDESGDNEVSASELRNHVDSTANPHSVTPSQIGAYTQEEVNNLFGGTEFDFYLSNDAEGIIANYNNLLDNVEDVGIEATIVESAVSDDATLIQAFITSSSQPDFTNLNQGIYNLHIHAKVSAVAGNNTIRLYYELYKRATNDSETLLITSEESNILTVSETVYEIPGVLSADETLDVTDRLVLKVYANVDTPAGANPDVTIYIEGNTASRIGIRTEISALDTRFLRTRSGVNEHNIVAFDVEGNSEDSGLLTLNVSDAVSKKHTQNTDQYLDYGGNYESPASKVYNNLIFLNVKDPEYGAVGDGDTDDTEAIQAAIDDLLIGANYLYPYGGIIYIPAGRYKITATLEFYGCRSFVFMGAGSNSTIFLWAGNDSSPMFGLYGVRESTFKDFYIVSSNTAPLDIGILSDTYAGYTATSNYFENIRMEGHNAGGLNIGVKMDDSAALGNNDYLIFKRVIINNYTNAGFYQADDATQTKCLEFIDCACISGGYGDYGYWGQGSFTWIGGSMASNKEADFYLKANDGVYITKLLTDLSTRFIQTPAGNSYFTVVVDSCNIYTTSGNVAVDRRTVNFNYAGQLILRNNTFRGVNVNHKIYFNPTDYDGSLIAENNIIANTLDDSPFELGSLGSATLLNNIQYTEGGGQIFLDKTIVHFVSNNNNAHLNLENDATPSAPVNGNIWRESNEIKYKINDIIYKLNKDSLDDYQGYQNLMVNGQFEFWYAGASAAPDGYIFGGGGSIARESTIKKSGSYSLKLISDSDGNYLGQQNIENILGESIEAYKSQKLTIVLEGYASDVNSLRVGIYDGVDVSYSDYHTGGSSWEKLTVTHNVNASANQISIYIYNDGDTKSVYIDNVMLVKGNRIAKFYQHSLDIFYQQNVLNISPFDVWQSFQDGGGAYNGLINFSPRYAYPNTMNQYMIFGIDIPTQFVGKRIMIDSIVVYYNTQANEDYIDQIQLNQLDGDGTVTALLTYADDIGKGSSGDGSQELLSAPLTLKNDKSLYFHIKANGSDTNSDVRFYAAVIKYHVVVK